METAIGLLPTKTALDTKGLKAAPGAMDELLKVDKGLWKQEIPKIKEHFAKFGNNLPAGLKQELADLEKRLG